MPISAPSRLDQELARIRGAGIVLPRHPVRALQSYGEGVHTNHGLMQAAGHDLSQMGMRLGRTISDANYNSPEVQRLMAENQAITHVMGQRRGLTRGSDPRIARQKRLNRLYPSMPEMARTGMMGGGGSPMGGDVYSAIPRFYDPLEYWDLSGLPWNVADEGHRHKLHKWLRLYYATHYLVPILVDIFTRFPLVGMELESKDNTLTEIYEDIFLNQLDYEDFLVSLGREYWCALPGELVQGVGGPIEIENVQAGDHVLTHTGEFHMVKGASSRHYEGGFVTIRPHYGLPMRYTDGHPFLVRRKGVVSWMPVEQITKTDELFVPIDQVSEEHKRINVWDTMKSCDWLSVPKDGDIDNMAIPDYVNWTDSEKKYHCYVRKLVRDLEPGSVWRRNMRYAQHAPLQEWINVDEELLWFLGLYLAEGYVTKDGVYIALHIKEIDYADRVIAFAASLGLNASIRASSENSIVVSIYSIAFGGWIESMIGTGVDGKCIPDWIMQLPKSDQAYFLRGYFDGDGHYGEIRIFAACKSRKLAMQIERLVRRMGVVSAINEAHSITKLGTECTWYMIGPCLTDTNHFAECIGVKPIWKDRQYAFAKWDECGYWVKVASIAYGQYSGPVYNIEVDGDHSYVGSVATHNCVGEAFPLGSFDEDLGIWDHEELINPEDVVIDNFPLLDSQQLKIVPPDYLRRIAQTQSPAREWYMLQEQYEDLIPYLLKGEHIPISPVMLRQVANKMNDWDDHGTPILMRGLRTLLHEEKLLASQDAIAERLYSPFILAKLGIMDMGDGLPPWIPSPDEIQSVRDDIDIAMASDFRVMVHHFGLEMTSVFGREQMPRLGDDFDRIERRLMQVFGVNPSLLSAGSNSQPYASSALQAEFMNQILRTFQKMLKTHFRQRAMVVAEAQGHFDYERKGQTRVPIYETVVEWDDDGNKRLVKKPKLLVPDLVFACLACGTRVNTPNGPVATETLCEGEEVLAWDVANDKVAVKRVTHSYDNGVHTCWRITTKLGRIITTTAEHPFLTTSGWQEAQELEIGTNIRVGTNIDNFQIPTITERDSRFFGLIVGDGCVSQCENGGVPMLANFDEEILRWVNHYVSGFGCSLKAQNGECAHDITQNDQRVNPNPIKALLRENELSGHNGWTKRIPPAVWSGGPGIWAAFLSGYLDSDGSVQTDKQVVWDSRNYALLRDCQDLLAYLGVRASLMTVDLSHWPDLQGNCHEGMSYRLCVASRESLNRLQAVLDPLCQRKECMSTCVQAVDKRRSLSSAQAAEIKAIVINKTNRLASPSYKEIGLQYNVSSSTIWRAVQGEYDDFIAAWVDPAWDQIKDIEIVTDVSTWSLGIEDFHTHITEGLVTHNTFDLRDEATERQFLMSLREAGVPIPDEKLMIGVSWKKDDYIEQYNRDTMHKTISQQRAKMDTYIACVIQGLPVPMDLKYEVESVLMGGTGPAGAPPTMGEGQGAQVGQPPGAPKGGGDQPGINIPPPPPGLLGPGGQEAPPGGGPPPAGPNTGGPPSNVPDVSNERRQGLKYNTHVASKDELDKLTAMWPEDMRKRATLIHDAIALGGDFSPGALEPNEPKDQKNQRLTDTVDESETDDPETWKLRAGQKVTEHEGQSVIVESKRKRVEPPIEATKKYSIIDPLAPELSEEIDESNELQDKSTG